MHSGEARAAQWGKAPLRRRRALVERSEDGPARGLAREGQPLLRRTVGTNHYKTALKLNPPPSRPLAPSAEPAKPRGGGGDPQRRQRLLEKVLTSKRHSRVKNAVNFVVQLEAYIGPTRFKLNLVVQDSLILQGSRPALGTLHCGAHFAIGLGSFKTSNNGK